VMDSLTVYPERGRKSITLNPAHRLARAGVSRTSVRRQGRPWASR
jgi:hypothetical protein